MSVLLLACTRETARGDLVTTYETLFNDHVDIRVDGYQGGNNPLTGFPVLVRLSEGSPAGFTYSRVDSLGADIRFLYTAKDGAVQSVPYEVDTWNTNGVSALWVRLPYLNNNAAIKLTMYWAPDTPSALPSNKSSATWSGYSAVWHMNSAASSTAETLGGSFGAASSAQTGVIGAARGVHAADATGSILSIPAGTTLDSLANDAYTISGWMKVAQLKSSPSSQWFYSTRTTPTENAYGAELVSGSDVKLKLHANAATSDTSTKSFARDEWVHVAVVHKGANAKHQIYLNGSDFYGPTALRTDSAGASGLAFGGLVGAASEGALVGDLDDVRIYPAALSQSWCTNEYLQAVSSTYLAFSNFSSTGKPVYEDDDPDPTPDDPSPGASEDVSPADYAGTAVFEPDGAQAGVVLTNFVTLITVWEGEPAGFDPQNLPFGTEDLRFFDNEGNVLDYDIDLWDAAGESAFWVKVPLFSASTEITMCWGLKEGKTLPANDPTAVWSDYAGVWHMTDESDSTANGATGAFGPSAVQVSGLDALVGKAVGTMVSGQKGAILEIEATEAIDALTNDAFTVSGWVYLDRTNVNYAALFSRATSAESAWGAQFCGGTSGNSSTIELQTGDSGFQIASGLEVESWVRFDCVYSGESLTYYVNGVKKGESVQARTIQNGTSGKFAIGGFVAAAEGALGVNTLRGYVDEFRLRAGAPNLAEIKTDAAQCSDTEYFYVRNPSVWDSTATVQNRWRVYPTASKTQWNEGDDPATFTMGVPWYGTPTLYYQNRSTGEVLGEMPTECGDYRAVFFVPQAEATSALLYSKLLYTIDFRIRLYRPTHDLGDGNDRVLILSGDQSISDGQVFVQAYSDTSELPGRPFWVHDVDTGFDYTSTSPYYNYCGGLRHTYYGRDGLTRLWDLIDVRYGNTYNNADKVFEETGGEWEEWEDGLHDDMNYLSWNPEGGTLVDDTGFPAGGWHEYAAQAVMCNTLKASVNSGLYTNGIGTIYFDAVNSHTDDATNGYYKLVVEMATNALELVRDTWVPSGLPTDDAIASTYDTYDADGNLITVVDDPYALADWKPLEMHVLLFNGRDGAEPVDLGLTDELTLDLQGGGSYTNFYRVFIPVDYAGVARFRIRRTAVNPEYTLVKDYRSLILVDNVICSLPTDRVIIEPRGFYDETKVKRETVGYEGAFRPSYPSVSDSDIYARAKAKSLSTGQTPTEGSLSSVLMHYRWRYLDQQATEWLTSDLDPNTFESIEPLEWPGISGDLEYWYEANQSSEFYAYADYSGLNLGLPGYSEEVQSVTNRAATYETEGHDWFTRIRDGKSTYGTIKLYVKRGLDEEVEDVEMFVARDQIWRGCLLATNALSDGLYFRFEVRNVQNDALSEFQFNTNWWYLADPAETLPASGSVSIGTTNDWGCVPCDGATGHLMFQLDEKTRALTVVHADWQDFNGWTDAHHDYFSGSSTDNVTKRGTSTAQREYLCYANQWTDDVSTNGLWEESFTVASGYSEYDFYAPFTKDTSPNGFDAGYGQWVRGAYADTSDLSGMALQMAGRGQGYVQLVDPIVHPRGLEAVKFSARIAQSVSPEDFAYYKGSKTESALYLDDYSFLTRVAFDLNANSNFTGNASLSLAAFYQPGESCYEARWEQIKGDLQNGTGLVLGPSPRGQRLVLYRWRYEGQEWKATELYAATNSADIFSWRQKFSPQAIPQAHSITNGLMPFMLGAYNDDVNDSTLVIAAIHIPGEADASKNVKGNTADATLYYFQNERGWLYLVYKDQGANRLTSGTYGVLSANCEGVFVRPQYHEGLVSWTNQAETRTLETQIWPDKDAKRSPVVSFYNYASARECVEDFSEGRWRLPSGRMEQFYDTLYDNYNGFCASVVTQTVDIYTAPIGTTSWQADYEPVASQTLTGFGKPGVWQDTVFNFWDADDLSVRIRTGGMYDRGVRTDVVVDNIQITQWRGQDWLGKTESERSQGGLTNFVYTSGWVTDGALQLSPRRTPDDYPCSLRVPLCDGRGTSRYKRGVGLGTLWFSYRNAQSNACLLVQIATNGVSTLSLLDYTLDPGDDDRYWTTITNFDFSAMTEAERASGVLSCSPGLHGVIGTMRIIVDPTLRDRVKNVTDPTAFGSVEIIEARFRDEPALDKGCWWGFNIRTIGDGTDSEKRMYLPDDPFRSPQPPPLEEIGLSFALNNSVTQDCDPTEVVKDPNPFKEHMPFLQTPTFSSNIVGEVSFRARKYSLTKGAQCAEIRLYGTRAADVDKVRDEDWELLNDEHPFIVSNTTYETYRFKTDTSSGYRAFRFAVTGVEGVTYPGPSPKCGDEPVRVLLDDVLVSEAIRARLAFRNVGAFRHNLAKTTYVANVPSTDEQPLCKEGWGIQAEIYPAMLGEEIDSSTKPKVRLHYYKGTSPWGYENWKTQATSAWLTEATDTNNFYRSSAYDSPEAVIPMSDSLEVVQYMLEVIYTVINTETGGRSVATNWLESTDWSTPSWYYPVDYNGKANAFAAFTILDEIAPGWAWINEINVFGMFDKNMENTDIKRQFVEIAKPVESSLEGWKLRMLAARNQRSLTSAIITNEVAVFGLGVSAEKDSPTADNMSFIVVGNPVTTLSRAKGEYDGAWTFPTVDGNIFNKTAKNYYLSGWEPVAIQLVRESGVIEHEVAIVGTNDWSVSQRWVHSSSNLVDILTTQNPKATFFALPDDCTAETKSVGVFDSRGEAAKWWNSTMKLTPGNINENQTIDPDHPTPGGELILVFASVDKIFGRIVQTVGAGTNTTEMQTVSIKSENEGGLDILYTVNPWCELGSVTETISGTTRQLAIPAPYGPRQYKVNVAKGASRNVKVLATATVDSRLREYGLTDSNRYTPAVLHWLEHHTDAYGNDFYGWQGSSTNDTIYLAQFLALSGEVEREMTLTEMYWLDMDPTASNMFFRAGMVRPPAQVVWKNPTYDAEHDPQAYTNLRMGVYMSISNGNGRVTHGDECVWAPYVLRGLGEGELSWNYATNTAAAWTSETFKVTGYLNNGLTSEKNATAWIPLRYFVFGENSFDANFESEIDVADPFSTFSPAYAQGWYQWVADHGGVKPPVYLSWSIDERLQQETADVLAPTNRLETVP